MTTKASTAAFHREDVQFVSGKELCAAWVYRPTSPPLGHAAGSKSKGPYPAMVLGHGLGAVKEMGLDRYASVFTELGIVCVVFDYRNFGQSGGEPRQLLDVQLQLDDWKAAIDYTSSLDHVDRERIGIFGSSFGGGHVISTAATDKRVKAVISQCPFTSGVHSAPTMGLLPLLRVGLLALRDLLFSRGNQIVPVQLCGRPGESKHIHLPLFRPP